jgi:hypothetical protein
MENGATFQSFESIPTVDWSDPNLRFIDLNGDGHADILIAQDELLVWYPSQISTGVWGGGDGAQGPG